jgi:murein DD-endopeptidase MepM/ murein hydrolase activator NlpD
VTEHRQSATFGRRKEPHTVIIARGSQIRHFTIRPWLAALAGSALAAMAVGYLLATSYLVLRDDLIGTAVARQARLQQAYEDRISALRAQVDRITSRQLLDQQLMESKVAELLQRQEKLTQRQGRMEPVLQRASTGAKGLPVAVPVPSAKPDLRAGLDIHEPAVQASAFSAAASPAPLSLWGAGPILTGESAADGADRLFLAINRSLISIETEQLARIRSLTENAWQTTEEIAEALQSAGLAVDAEYGDAAAGGPLLAANDAMLFDTEVRELDDALNRLDAIRGKARELPIANPAPGRPISSSFGMRRDPLLGMPAHHSGMDFRAPTGTAVVAAGPGTVISAGWNGGYGRMVEVDHGGGFTTRYAHLKSVAVKPGQKLTAGETVGRVGSSGRSTGPHLHYEVRKEGAPIDPLRFIKAGKRVAPFL